MAPEVRCDLALFLVSSPPPLILIILSYCPVFAEHNQVLISEQGLLRSWFLLTQMSLLHIIQVANSYIAFKSPSK